ncbi:MAG: peptidylprolyl isomerase [Halioglobus sp.]|nr:peptidylprolyl isomerase [Halioglobus sp.]
MKLKTALLLLLFVGCVRTAGAADVVVEDGGVSLSREELEYLVKYWTPEMQHAAAVDAGDRIELLNMALAGKKIAQQAEGLPPGGDLDTYWRHIFAVRNIQRDYMVKRYLQELDIPDMSELAKERYLTEKKKYALVPEQRSSSHILLRCPAGECDRSARRPEAQALLEELRAGADFEEMAKEKSEDPGSRAKGGKFDRWLTLGEAQVDPYFTGGVFSIEEVGEYSDVVDTRFGLHIIRLDEVRPAHYKPYEEVKDDIMAALEKEYKQLAAKEFDARYRLTDDAKIDTAAMDEIFSPYKPADSEQ